MASIEMPPLREMPEVIPPLAERLVGEFAAEFHRPAPLLDETSFAGLEVYSWPGNVRELRNAVERALIFHEAGPLVVRPPAAPIEPRPAPSGFTLEPGSPSRSRAALSRVHVGRTAYVRSTRRRNSDLRKTMGRAETVRL